MTFFRNADSVHILIFSSGFMQTAESGYQVHYSCILEFWS